MIFSSAVVALYGCGATNPPPSSTSSVSSITNSSSSSSSDPVVADEALVLALNAGGTSPATFEGVEYQTDRFGSGGSTQTVSDPIAGVTEDALYQSERFGDSRYEIPVSNATYSIVLHFAELYHTSADARGFSVTVEGQSALEDLDLFSEAGHDGADEVDNVPIYHANYPIGHGDAYFQDNGGEFGIIAVGWLNWMLKDDMSNSGKGMFIGDNCRLCQAPWTAKHKGF